MTETELPKYLKDETGFCYVATPQLMTVKRLTPYDGEIDAHGMAVEGEAKPARQPRQSKSKTRADEAPASEPAATETPADETPADETPASE